MHNCIVCGAEIVGRRKTCNQVCWKKNRSRLSKRKWIHDKASETVKEKYRTGKMEYMKNVWEKNRERTGEKNPRWKGGRKKSRGYILVLNKNHHRADFHGYVPEHILIMEKYLGKKIEKNFDIHHINGIKDDNRIENLYLCNRTDHSLLHKRFFALAKTLLEKKYIKFENGEYVII